MGAMGVPLFIALWVQAATVRVPADRGTVQAALDAAADGDVVLVAPGTYEVDAPLDFNALHDPADPLSPPVKDLVLRSEAGPLATTIRMAAEPADPLCASVIIFQRGESSASAVEGFTITGGRGSLHEERLGGGGVLCRGNSSPTLRDCRVTGNVAEIYGGGILCESGAAPAIMDCHIAENAAEAAGGIYCARGTSPAVIGCLIERNVGWGIYAFYASPSISRCTVRSNHGGGILSWHSDAQVYNCRIIGNWAEHDGGGLYASNLPSPSFVNCIVAGNWAASAGGIYCAGGAPSVTNCTVVRNAADAGGGISCTGSSPRIHNCIVTHHGHGSLTVRDLGDPQVTHSCFQEEAWTGPGNIAADPLFVDYGQFVFTRFADLEIQGRPYLVPDFVIREPDLRLTWFSPARDAGTSDQAPREDFEGDPRPCERGVDMGADEYCRHYQRGDVNDDGVVNVADAIRLMGDLFAGPDQSACRDASDANDDGTRNLADAVRILGYLFGGAGPLPPPFAACAIDPTPDGLDCESFPRCER